MRIWVVAMGLICCAIPCVTLGQLPGNRPLHRSLYLEAGGVAGYASIHYQHEAWHSSTGKLAFFLRGGVGTLHIRDFRRKFNPDLMVPALAGFRMGMTHALELALGCTWTYLVHSGETPGTSIRTSSLNPVGNIGYRYQSNGGFCFRVAFTPILENGQTIRPWAGISAGVAF